MKVMFLSIPHRATKGIDMDFFVVLAKHLGGTQSIIQGRMVDWQIWLFCEDLEISFSLWQFFFQVDPLTLIYIPMRSVGLAKNYISEEIWIFHTICSEENFC